MKLICSMIISLIFLVQATCGQYPILTKGGSTSIIVILNDTIYFAADSRQTIKLNNVVIGFEKTDKIQHHKNIFFTVVGYSTTISIQGIKLFDVVDVIKHSIGEQINVDSVILKAATHVYNQLNNLYDMLPKQAKAQLLESTKDTIYTISMASAMSDQLKYAGAKIIFDRTLRKFKSEIIYYDPNFPVFVTGTAAEVLKKLNKEPGIFKGDILQVLAMLIGLEVQATPHDVGGPGDAVKIYKGGFNWCQDIPIK